MLPETNPSSVPVSPVLGSTLALESKPAGASCDVEPIANVPSLLGRSSNVCWIEWAADSGCLRFARLSGNAEMFGFDADDVAASSATLLESINSDVQKKLRQHLRQFANGKTDSADVQFELSNSQSVRWMHLETFAVYDPHQRRHKLQSLLFDRTDQRQAENQSELLVKIINSVPSWIFVKGEDHKYQLVNRSYAKQYGLTPEQCIGKTAIDLGVEPIIALGDPGKDIRGFYADDHAVLTSNKPMTIHCEPINLDGKSRFLQTVKTPIVGPDNEKLLVGFAHDITYLKNVERQIKTELDYNRTLNEINEILRSQDTGMILLDNVCQQMLQTLSAQHVEIKVETGTGVSGSATASQSPGASTQISLHRISVPVEYAAREVGTLVVDRRINVESETAVGSFTTEEERLIRAIANQLAISLHQQRLIEQMNHLAQHDSLTELPNRHNLRREIKEAIQLAGASNDRCAVIFLDLDGFKAVNDTLGHHVGDRLLVAVAQRLKQLHGPDRFLARLGGDEFAILLTDIPDRQAGIDIAQSYLALFEESMVLNEREVHIGASLGISFFPDDADDTTTLLRNADSAMYQAKASGKNASQCFTPAIAEAARERLDLEADLRRALVAGDQLFLHYQPKFQLETGDVTGVEALVRWNHPTRGQLSPAHFIPIAEESGLIVPLGQWLVREACQTVGEWNRLLDRPISISINVSPPEIDQPLFVDDLVGTLEAIGFDPQLLELEVTETFVMQHIDIVSVQLQRLRNHGIRIAIDDFGTGYSCMSYLQQLPVDTLKIDKSFVDSLMPEGLDSDESSTSTSNSIARTIIDLARSMNLQTVAEGIETQAQWDTITALGADYGQGYLLSRPMPAAEALDFLRRSN